MRKQDREGIEHVSRRLSKVSVKGKERGCEYLAHDRKKKDVVRRRRRRRRSGEKAAATLTVAGAWVLHDRGKRFS